MVWPPLLIRLAMTASGTARILAISLLILSVAPWASIYAVMVSLHSQGTTTSYPSDQSEEIPTLASILQKENATLEELLIASLFYTSKGVNLNFLFPDAQQSLGHWTVVLPWAISLLLGIVIPFLVSLTTFMVGRDEFALEPNEDPWISRHRKEHRLSRLVVACEDYRKILTEKDMICKPTGDKDYVPKWELPLPGSKACDSTTSTTRTIEGTCAVCLGQYAAGDEVIWSSNPKCLHVFHDDCILSWLLRRRKQCPCCRQAFLIKTKAA